MPKPASPCTKLAAATMSGAGGPGPRLTRGTVARARQDAGKGRPRSVDLVGPSAPTRPDRGGFEMKRTNVSRTELTPLRFLRAAPPSSPTRRPSSTATGALTLPRSSRSGSTASPPPCARAGLDKHDRVAFLCPNIPAMLEAHFGVPPPAASWSPSTPGSAAARSATSSSTPGRRFLFVDAELRAGGGAARSRRHSRVVRVDDTGAAGDPYEDFLAAGSPEPVELARRRGRDDRHQLHLGHHRPAERRDVHPPRRLPQRPRRAARDRA